MTIAEMGRRLKSVDLPYIINNTLNSQAEELVQINRDQLYKQSLLSTGEQLQLYGSIPYALDKEKLNPLPGFLHPDLYLTGDFYAGFTIKVDSQFINFNSSDSKTDKLVLNYTQYIFGLTQQNKTIYAKGIFYDALKKYITAQTGLQFR